MTEREGQVLLAEDDDDLATMIAEFLQPHGFTTIIENRGDRAVERILSEVPDVVLLDVGLPGLDGFSVCREIRSRYSGPILIMTARGDEVDEVIGLELGADDYLNKPVSPRVLLARLRAHLRKSSFEDNNASPIRVGQLLIDPSRRAVELVDQSIALTTLEFDLLWLLGKNVGQVVSRNSIYQHLHGVDHDGLDRSVDLCISRLRKKLGDSPTNPELIKSVRSVGYLLATPR